MVNDENKNYSKPPASAWSCSPPRTTVKKNSEQKQIKQSNTQSTKSSEKGYNKLKYCIEESQKKNAETLSQINNKVDKKAKEQKSTIQLLVKELLNEELKKVIPEIVHTILSQIKEGIDQTIDSVKDVDDKSTSGNKADMISQVTASVSDFESQKSDDNKTKSLNPDKEEALLTQ
eukprot:8105175-Ditylum_brightwellii.AAC.1